MATIFDATLPETNGKFAPENRPKPNRKDSNHPFSGAMLVSGRVFFFFFGLLLFAFRLETAPKTGERVGHAVVFWDVGWDVAWGE